MISQIIFKIRQKNVPLKNPLIILFLVFSTIASATNYYICSSGNDTNNGLSSSTPWATIAKVNASSFSAGDTIFFNRGDTWREQLIVPSSGNSRANITFSAYGVGKKPIIMGSDLMVNWTDIGNYKWTSPLSTEPNSVYFDGVVGILVASSSHVTGTHEWFYDTGSKLLYIYSPSDPDVSFINPGIEACIRDYCILAATQKNYIVYQFIELMHARIHGLYQVKNFTNVTAESLVVHNNGECPIQTETYDGLKMEGGSYVTIKNCDVYENGWNGISVQSWSGWLGDKTNWLIENCKVYNNAHIGINITAGTRDVSNVVIRYNEMYGQGNGIYIFSSTDNKAISDLHVYCNLVYDNTQTGILIGDINRETHISSAYVYNNTTIGNGTIGTGRGLTVHATGSLIKNNIIANNEVTGLSVVEYEVTGESNISDYNVIYNSLHPASAIIEWDLNSLTYSSFKSTTGQESHGVSDDPSFVSYLNFHLQSNSPCINAGKDVGLTTDLDGNKYKLPPSIGTYEYDPKPTSTVIPVYQNSVMENATPSPLETTYNIILANIAPATSTFSVRINSVARIVNTVAISGKKVFVTLSIPIVYGNVVTISYTKPSSNPLQATSIGIAASISNQSISIGIEDRPILSYKVANSFSRLS